MNRPMTVICALLVLASSAGAHAADQWVEGRNYYVVTPAQHPSVPAGKVEVTEVFSYGCMGTHAEGQRKQGTDHGHGSGHRGVPSSQTITAA